MFAAHRDACSNNTTTAFGKQQEQPPSQDVMKPGVTTRSGLAAGGGGSRRALGDITNARGNNNMESGKMVSSKTRSAATTVVTGLASAAPVMYQQLPATIQPESKKVDDEVADMDLIQEVDEIDMNIEIEEDQRQEELGAITENLQTMTIKHPVRSVLGPDVDDIDKADSGNPMACIEYVEDQYMHYREKECRPGYDPGYMVKQPHINARMRAILVDWLVEVHYKFKCCPETLYLTMNIIDRFLDRKQVPRAKLQLVGVTAFLIACKYEEIYPPEVKELVYMTDGAYTRKQIIDMEAFMLATLKFQVTVCTTHCFLVRFLKAGHADNKIYFLASYICERTLQEVDVLCFLPSMVAAAAVYLARKNVGLRPWSPTLQHYTKYTEESLLSCLRLITPWLSTRSQTLQAIRKKYGSVKFMMVSNMDLEGI